MTRTRYAPPARPALSPEWKATYLTDALTEGVVMGLDLSYTSTGIAIFDGGRMLSRALQGKALRGSERLEFFFDFIGDLAVRWQPQLVVIEDYAFDAKFGREQAGELGGVVKLTLHRAGINYVTASSSQLKKFATGVGNCDKSIVGRELYKRYGVDAQGNDETDACGLALLGAAHLGGSIVMTAKQREAAEALGQEPAKKTRKKKAS